MQLNFENLIFETFQTPAVGKTLKPYQGLKHQGLKPPDLTSVIRVFVPRRKNPKTLSGIETAKAKLLDRILPVVGKTLKPY
jgi:hypothetical protein